MNEYQYTNTISKSVRCVVLSVVGVHSLITPINIATPFHLLSLSESLGIAYSLTTWYPDNEQKTSEGGVSHLAGTQGIKDGSGDAFRVGSPDQML